MPEVEIKVNKSFKIESSIWNELNIVARENGMTRSKFLRMLIFNAIEEHKKK